MIPQDQVFRKKDQRVPMLINTLTYSESQAAVLYLKQRFPHLTIHQIIDAIQKQLHTPKPYSASFNNLQPSPPTNCFENQQSDSKSREEKRKLDQQKIRLVAHVFCQEGQDYEQVKIYFPDIERTAYRNMLLSMANTTFKELVSFLKKEGFNIKEISQPLKISIKTALLNARLWMVNQNPVAFSTFVTLIQKRYLQRNVPITKQQAANLYSTIAARVNCQTLDISAEKSESSEEINFEPESSSQPQFSNEQRIMKIFAQNYLEFKNITQISNQLSKKYGLDDIWEEQSVKDYISQILRLVLEKLWKEEKEGGIQLQPFQIDDDLISLIMTPPNLNLHIALVELYLSKTQSKETLKFISVSMTSLLREIHNIIPELISQQQPINLVSQKMRDSSEYRKTSKQNKVDPLEGHEDKHFEQNLSGLDAESDWNETGVKQGTTKSEDLPRYFDN